MAAADRRLRIDARSLLAQPGLEREIDLDLPPEDLGLDDERIVGPIEVRLTVTSNLDGIIVGGTVAIPWRASCRRCLVEAIGSTVVDVDEFYRRAADAGAGGDAFPIEGDQVDLHPAVREAVLLELPDDVLCSQNCAGICPQCGSDRNTAPCACDLSVRDDRWSALDALRDDGA
ncbi:MAG: YceD family protein [Ilumatobacteraceae bacterium]